MPRAQLKVVAPGYLLFSLPSSFWQPALAHRGELWRMPRAQLKVVAPGYLLFSLPSSFWQPALAHRGEL
jgi:hypothetical protein